MHNFLINLIQGSEENELPSISPHKNCGFSDILEKLDKIKQTGQTKGKVKQTGSRSPSEVLPTGSGVAREI